MKKKNRLLEDPKMQKEGRGMYTKKTVFRSKKRASKKFCAHTPNESFGHFDCNVIR